MGSNTFCLKICDPAGSNPAGLCQHTLDEIGCAYNAPSKYTVDPIASPGTFETCESDNMGVPGVYVSDGQTLSYAQPRGDTPIGQVPYSATIPASSNCVTSASAALYTSAIVATTTSPATTTSGGSSKTAASATGVVMSNMAVTSSVSIYVAAFGVVLSLFLA